MRSKLLLGVGLCLLVLRCQEDEPSKNNPGTSGTAGQGGTGGGDTGGSSGTSGTSNPGGESGDTGTGGVAGTGGTAGSSGSGGKSGSGGASGEGGTSGGEGGEGGGGDGLSTVTGIIRSTAGGRLAGVLVTIGDDTVATDANGVFTIEDVPETYDLVTIEEASHYIRVVHGLTTRTPMFWSRGVNTEKTAAVNGTISGTTFPLATRNYLWVGYSGPNDVVQSFEQAAGADGSYDVDPVWFGPNATDITLYALHELDNAELRPTQYFAFGSKVLTVSNAGSYSPGAATTIPLQPIGDHDVSGMVTVPAGYDPVVWVNVGPFWTDTVEVPIDGGPWATILPTGIPSELAQYVQLHAEHEIATGKVEVSEPMFHVTEQTSTLALTAPAAPRALLPIDNASGVDLDTTFSWSQPAGSIATFIFGDGVWQYDVTVTGTSVKLPDLSSAGIVPAPGGDCQWAVGVALNVSNADEFSTHETDPIAYVASHGHSGVGFTPVRDCTLAD